MQEIIPAISLEIIVILLGVLMIFSEAFSKCADRSHLPRYAIGVLAAVFGFSFFTQAPPSEIPSGSYWQFYTNDAPSMLFKRIAIATTIFVLVMALEYRKTLSRYIPAEEEGRGTGEFYALPVFICAGLMLMASAVDFILIFVALELVTIGFYVLVAYMRRNHQSLEAGVKYLILGALSTGFLVYGITWIFGLTGQTHLFAIKVALSNGFAPHGSLIGNETALLFGIMLVLVALGFKIAATPFQFWVPDVYQGAPTPVTAFLSVGSKAAGFIVLIRVLDVFLAVEIVRDKVIALLVILAAATLLFGNFAAIPQGNLKRLFAYSSIAHAGYLLLACASYATNPADAKEAIGFYLVGYLLMTLLSFLILISVARNSRGDEIYHFNGLGKRSPFLAFGMTIAIASLAGIPLTIGFIGKFLVFKSAVAAGQWTLICIGILGVGAGFYYYFKIIAAMYWQEPGDSTPITIGPLTRASICILAISICILGVWPKPIIAQLREKNPSIQKKETDLIHSLHSISEIIPPTGA